MKNEEDKKLCKDEHQRIFISDELHIAETLITKKRAKPSVKTNIPNLVLHKKTKDTNKPE